MYSKRKRIIKLAVLVIFLASVFSLTSMFFILEPHNEFLYKSAPLYPPKLAIWNGDLVLWEQSYDNIEALEKFYNKVKNHEPADIMYSRYETNVEDYESIEQYAQVRGPIFHTFVRYKVTFDGESIHFQQLAGEKVPWDQRNFNHIEKEEVNNSIYYILVNEEGEEYLFVEGHMPNKNE